MNGSENFVKSAVTAGISVCFNNPGTTELPIINALDTVPGIRSILCLFEGGCTGAADGYGRMADSPAMTLLHLGPGFGNGIANLHNARRADTPVFNVIGEHAMWHRAADPPLTMDIEQLAQTVSLWQRTLKSSETISKDTVEAIKAAYKGMIATLVFPHNLQLEGVTGEIYKPGKQDIADVDEDAVSQAITLLKKGGRTAMILGGRALRKNSLLKASKIKQKTGCELYCETFTARMEKGQGLPQLKRIPYFANEAVSELSQYQSVVLVGAKEPISFFGWPGFPGKFLNDDQTVICLAKTPLAVQPALDQLAEALTDSGQAMGADVMPPAQSGKHILEGELNAENACAVLAMNQPEGAIVVDESITAGMLYYEASHSAPPHTVLGLTGGAIGSGIPMSLGAAIACPDRPVINLQADGSAMYTLQALWTQARESLNITTLICSNRSYDILKVEMMMAGHATLGKQAELATTLDHPSLDWVNLSKGLGVPAVSVTTTDQLETALKRALKEPGPNLIEMKFKKLF